MDSFATEHDLSSSTVASNMRGLRFWEFATLHSPCPSAEPSPESEDRASDWPFSIIKGCLSGAAYLNDSSISCPTEKTCIKTVI